MQVLILNSGTGKRMGPFTKHMPKCLVSLHGGETILGRQLRMVREERLKDVIITTGPFRAQLKRFVSRRFPGMRVTYVHNPRYRTTNYLYSMFLASDFLADDVLLMHGDMVFDEKAWALLLNAPGEDKVMVSSERPLPEKDFKGRISTGKVVEIGVNVFGDDCLCLQPMYVLSRKTVRRWVAEIAKFVERKELGIYAEDALNAFAREICLLPVRFTDDLCMEVDNPADLEAARRRLTSGG
jgi:phosphoenolpyruvate phosphomutase